MNIRHELNIYIYSLFAVSAVSQTISAQFVPGEWKIPANANSYITTSGDTTRMAGSDERTVSMAMVGRAGLILKNDTQSVASAYIYIVSPAQPRLSLNVLGEGLLSVSCEGQELPVSVKTDKWQKVYVGQLKIKEPHYIRLDFQLKKSNETSFIIIRDIILSDLPTKPIFVGSNFSDHFGRRGPSVHLRYHDKEAAESDWVVSELMVPEGNDIVGSFFCPLNFDGGFFGIQNISVKERRILFSVWNSCDPDVRRNVPADSRVKLVGKNPSAIVNMLDDGSNAMQCYINYCWKTGKTYRFALHAEHAVQDATDYSAFFFDPEKNTWNYIATVRRPQTSYLLSELIAFVENFVPEEGYRPREAYFGPLWMHATQDNQWHCITKAAFSYDDTGRRGIRVDFSGGVAKNRFFLKMGGFFGNGSLINGEFEIPVQENRRLPINTDELLLNQLNK